ncbi:hypothetical protein BDW69DRAFT_54242 [Aspergillus filifer]
MVLVSPLHHGSSLGFLVSSPVFFLSVVGCSLGVFEPGLIHAILVRCSGACLTTPTVQIRPWRNTDKIECYPIPIIWRHTEY